MSPHKKLSRPSRNEYFMNIAKEVATMSTCLSRKIGSVLVRDNRILSTGYNGPPSGIRHCEKCSRREANVPSGEWTTDICYAVHSEQNAIIQAAIHGVSTRRSTIFCTVQPCFTCAKMIVNAGIESVVYQGEYDNKKALELFYFASVTCVRLMQ